MNETSGLLPIMYVESQVGVLEKKCFQPTLTWGLLTPLLANPSLQDIFRKCAALSASNRYLGILLTIVLHSHLHFSISDLFWDSTRLIFGDLRLAIEASLSTQ